MRGSERLTLRSVAGASTASPGPLQREVGRPVVRIGHG